MQIDLLVVNGAEAVVVEVKSKLTQADVDEHLQRLDKFKRLLPRYADVRAMRAVAAMVVPQEVGRYAYRQGLYVPAQSGESVVILNDAKFQAPALVIALESGGASCVEPAPTRHDYSFGISARGSCVMAAICSGEKCSARSCRATASALRRSPCFIPFSIPFSIPCR